MLASRLSRRFSYVVTTALLVGAVGSGCGDDDDGTGGESGGAGLAGGGRSGGSAGAPGGGMPGGGGTAGMAPGGATNGGSQTGGREGGAGGEEEGGSAGQGDGGMDNGAAGAGMGGGGTSGAGAGGGGTSGAGTGGGGTSGAGTGGGGTAGTGGGGTSGAGTGGGTSGAGTGGTSGAGTSGGGTGGVNLYDFAAVPAQIPLAPGGVNWVDARFTSTASTALALTLTASPPSGATAIPTEATVNIAAMGMATEQVMLTGTTITSGQAELALIATGGGGVAITRNVTVLFSDDMARNAVSAPFPRAFASSNQDPYPPSEAVDGDSASFWVSGGTLAGQGPDPQNPEHLGIDFGAPVRIGSVTMTPRLDRGPTAYAIEASDDGVAWSPVADVAAAANAAITTVVDPPVTRRHLRLLITGSRDPGGPSCPAPCDPRNVQIVSLEVRTAP